MEYDSRTSKWFLPSRFTFNSEVRVTGLRQTMNFQCYILEKQNVFLFTGWPASFLPRTAD